MGEVVHLEYSPSGSDRGPNVVNGYKLFIKSLKNPSCSSWPPHLHKATQPLYYAYLSHARFPKQLNIFYFKKTHSISICPILRRPPKAVLCWDQTFPHRECSRPSFATPSSRPTSSSLHTLWKVLPVSPGFSLVASLYNVSVLCHSVHIRSSMRTL